MTTQAQSPKTAVGPTTPAAPSPTPASPTTLTADVRLRIQAGLRRIRTDARPLLRKLWSEQRHWLILAVLLTVIFAWPIRWFWQTWTAPDSPLSYQPFIPIGAIWLALLDRPHTMDQYRELALLFPEDSPKRRGKIWLALIGCVLMVLSYLAVIPPLTMIALMVMIAGIIYYAYGPYILGALKRPLGFLLAMAPVPNVVISTSTANLQLGCAAVAGQILHALNPRVEAVGTFIQLPNYKLEVAGPCSGISVLFPVLAMTLWLALYKRMRFGPALILLTVSAGLSLLMNVLRIVALGLIGSFNASLAQQMHDTNSAIFTALAFYLTFLAAGLIQRPWLFPWQKKLSQEEMHFGYYAPLSQPEENATDAPAVKDKNESGVR